MAILAILGHLRSEGPSRWWTPAGLTRASRVRRRTGFGQLSLQSNPQARLARASSGLATPLCPPRGHTNHLFRPALTLSLYVACETIARSRPQEQDSSRPTLPRF